MGRTLLIAALALAALPAGAGGIEGCRLKGIPLHGKVKRVESFPDLKVQVVRSFPDLKVQVVDSFPDRCGEWQWVESFPDVTVQIVDSFPDLKIELVDSFPGVK